MPTTADANRIANRLLPTDDWCDAPEVVRALVEQEAAQGVKAGISYDAIFGWCAVTRDGADAKLLYVEKKASE